MATIHDRHNPSRKVTVQETGELAVIPKIDGLIVSSANGLPVDVITSVLPSGISVSSKQDSTISELQGVNSSLSPGGVGLNGAVTLVSGSTAYSIPASAPTENYVIVLYNGSDTDMFVGYENSNANGLLFPSGGRMSFDLGANQVVYAYCGSAGKILSYSLKKIK